MICNYQTLILLLALLTGCASSSTNIDAVQGVEFFVVRHAEKATYAGDDPPITDAGHRRAASLATIVSTPSLRAVYATSYRRTQQTAAPAARMHGLSVTSYDGKQSAMEFADYLRRTHATGRVLVVGHSNTVPAIVAALCGCETAPMADDEYARLSIIHIEPGGRARLEQRRF